MSEENTIGESQEAVTPEIQAEIPETALEENQADTAEQPKEEKHEIPKGLQKRIDRLTRDKYRLQAELEMERRNRPQQQPQPQQPANAPQSSQYASYDEYLEALADYKAEQKVAKTLQEHQERTRQQSEQAAHAKIQESWMGRVEAAQDAYDDFEEVAFAPDVPITGHMRDAIMRADKGADVAYYLGKHKDEAARIAQLDPYSQLIAIGRLEATIAAPQPKKTTSAPPPINPVGTKASASKDPSKMTDAEFAAWRREQIKRRG